MPFVFKQITISGASDPAVSGPAKFIQEARLFLEEAGWAMVDDRTAQAGSANPALTHKMVFSSNGENGEYPTFYLTIFSGTGAGVTSNVNAFLMHTAYDTGISNVPASGVSSFTNHGQDTANTLNVPSISSDVDVWMSGDSEGVAFVSRQHSNNAYDAGSVGKLKVFQPPAVEPYGLYVLGTAGTTLDFSGGATSRLVAGNPPLFAGTASNNYSFITVPFPTNSQPYDMGSVTSIYFARPILAAMTVSSDLRAVVGAVPNYWAGAGTGQGLLMEGVLTASGVGGIQTYQVFPSTNDSIIIRTS